jgi:hypothetical protein
MDKHGIYNANGVGSVESGSWSVMSISSGINEKLIARYATVPMGAGKWSVYDCATQTFVAHCESHPSALREWHILIGLKSR